ncbi:MAG: hypothetical protein UY95_C0011G0008 [Parcubacteria group bacterium GW2011_GWA2_56_7]|nr:MAG: hypothetical protein UY95_C0011G0008 [Parcubacteria group bacterium GW2011_GWA2_56_7]
MIQRFEWACEGERVHLYVSRLPLNLFSFSCQLVELLSSDLHGRIHGWSLLELSCQGSEGVFQAAPCVHGEWDRLDLPFRIKSGRVCAKDEGRLVRLVESDESGDLSRGFSPHSDQQQSARKRVERPGVTNLSDPCPSAQFVNDIVGGRSGRLVYEEKTAWLSALVLHSIPILPGVGVLN